MFETISLLGLVFIFAFAAVDTIDRIFKYYEDKYRNDDE